MNASDYQVGGDHYRSEYQHWDWAIDIRLGYLESAATKYVTRWKGKNGPQDVEKAIHYLTKAKEAYLERRYHNGATLLSPNKSLATLAVMNTEKFCDLNNFVPVEQSFMLAVAGWQNEGDLAVAIGLAKRIHGMAVEAAQARGGAGATPAPGKAATAPQAAKTGAAGRAGGATTQGAASSASTGVHDTATEGMEHPFGYDAAEETYPERPECDFTNHKAKS